MYTKIIRSLSKGKNEANLIKKVMNHPNIIKMYDFDYINLNNNTIGIELQIENHKLGDLADMLINPNNEMNIRQKRKIFFKVVDAVEYCHKNGVAHLDIKPENILMKNDSIPILADFGCSRPLNCIEKKHSTMSFFSMSTNGYCPPEISNRRYYCSRSDIWSLACLGYAMFTIKMPPLSEDIELNPYLLQHCFEKDKDYFPDDLYNLFYSMSHPYSDKRPYAFEIKDSL